MNNNQQNIPPGPSLADLDIELIMEQEEVDKAALVPGRTYLVHFADC